MSNSKVMMVAMAGIALIALSACSSGGGSSGTPAAAPTGGGTTAGGGTNTGGGTATGSLAAFDAKALDYNLLVPTSTPLTGTADYAGEISMLTQANAANPSEAVVGDLNMTVAFNAGVSNPVTATAGNFAGEVNGAQTTIGGTLSTANAIGSDPNMVTAQTTPVGTLTSATATLRGTLNDPAGALSGDARMILNGSLKEAGGAKMGGGHQTTITPAGGGSPIGTGGSLWADKQ